MGSVHLFQSHNYKLGVSIGLTRAVLFPVRSVLDTGAGPNLVREDILPSGWDRLLIPNLPLPRITNASGKRMPVKGVITLFVQVGNLVRRVRFYVTPGLGVPCILGCNFINLHVRSIHPKERRIDLIEGGSVAISTGAGACQISGKEPRTPTASPKVRLARKTVIPARCEMHVEVTSADNGLHLVVHHSTSSKTPIALASGVVDIRAQIPFRVRVINPSNRDYTLQKGMIMGKLLPHLERIITVGAVLDETTSEKETPDLNAEEVSQAGNTRPEKAWQEEVDLSHLDSEERGAVLDLLEPHKKMWDGHLGTVAATSHRIDVIPGSKPVHCQPYRAGPRARAAEKEEIDRMLEQQVIEPATGEWASPIVLVPKPDGSLRFCVDYRRLNAMTVPDTYPLPRMDECIDSLGDAVIFTTLDCNSGYWQIPVQPEDQDKTTFTSHYGTYRFLRLPFGLRNAPATFQRAIDIILSGVRWKTCLVYLDDVIVFSSCRKAHLAHVAEVLTVLGNAGLSLKLQKCRFFAETVNYLGHVIRPGRLGVAEKNTEALKAAPLPRTQTELRSFLGLCNVYRRFVPRFSAIAAPLNALLCKGMPPNLGCLTPEAIAAFETLRDRLLSPPVLALPRAVGQMWLDTDASDGQLGCCLLQRQPDDQTLPLGYWSRTLSSAERNYSTTEKECLAIVWAVTHLRPYLERTEFIVRTDHHALRWVMNLSDAQGRLARWRLRLAEFIFKVEYHPGAAHYAADAMSRLPHQPVPRDPIEDEIPVCTVVADHSSALEENSSSPVREVPLISTEVLFEHQCLDPIARRLRQTMLHDPSWDFDVNGLLVERLPSGEVQVHVPPSLRHEGPCAVLTISHVAGDGSDLGGGTQAAQRTTPVPRPTNLSVERMTARRPIRLLTRTPLPRLGPSPLVGLALLSTSACTIPTGRETNVAAVSTEELRKEQATDPTCQRLLAMTGGLYDVDDDGLLIRIAPIDGSHQVVVPDSLTSRILYLEHYPPAVGHPGAHRMFRTMRRSFFWPRMAEDVYETIRQCDHCARNRITEKRHTNPLRLFPANGPLESVAMDILGPLPRTKHGNRFLLVITDRFSKVTKTVPLRTVTALSVARAFCDHWVYAYGPPISLLTDNGPQFTAKFFLAVCSELGVHKVFTTAYHPQTNGQVERYNRTILASLRGYVAHRQDDWDDYTSTVTYAYNCRVHSSLGMPPFELALSRPPPTLSLQVSPRPEEVSPKTLKREFLERLKTLRLRAGVNLHKAQARYKRNYDRGVYPKNTGLTEGDEAYVRVEVTETGRNHKLESLVQGPYRVVENAGTTFRLQIGDEVVRVSSDRVTRAPSPVNPDTEPRSPVSLESISAPACAEEGSQTSPLGVQTESHSSTGPVTNASPTGTPIQDLPTSGPSTNHGASSTANLGRPSTSVLSRRKPGSNPRRSGRRVRFTLPSQAHSDLPTRAEPSQPERRQEEPPSSDREYVIEKLVGAANGEDGQHIYRVRWWGYDAEEDTWETAEQLPAHFIRRYWRSKGLSTPSTGAYLS